MRVLSLICCFVGIMLTYSDTQASVNFIVNKSEITQTDSSNLEKPISETTCPTGYEKVGGICMDVNACETAFPLTSASDKVGSYVTKDCGTKGTRYCYTSCQTGWEKSGCECKAVDCSGFPFSESNGHHCNGIKSCKTGSNYKYQCTDCVDGYTLSSGSCVDKACSDHGTGYYSPVTDNCTSVKIGKTGDTYCYKCTKCKEGWTLNETNYKCDKNSCDYSTSRISNCIKYASITKTGSGLCYKCSTCADGYTLNTAGTACSSINCSTGYTTGMTNLSHCTNASTHVAGTSYCHKCNTCAGEYYVSGSKCAACDWQGHGLSSCPGNCNCSSKSCGILTKYKVTSAKSGYYVSGSTCPACTWASDHTLTSCPSNCNCSSNRVASACSYKYKVTSAKANYYVSGNSCPACTWGGRSLTSCPSNCYCDSDTCGGSTKYRITSAVNGYTISGNSCVCDMSSYPLSSCPSNCNCGSKTCGSTTKYYVSSATADHYVSGNSCPACTWDGYTLDSCPTWGNCYTSACGGRTKYALWYCSYSYQVKQVNGTCVRRDCDAEGATSYIGGYLDWRSKCNVNCGPKGSESWYDAICCKSSTINYLDDDCYAKCHAGFSTFLPSRHGCFNAMTIYYDGSTPIAVKALDSENVAIALTDESDETVTYTKAKELCEAKTTGGKTWKLPPISLRLTRGQIGCQREWSKCSDNQVLGTSVGDRVQTTIIGLAGGTGFDGERYWYDDEKDNRSSYAGDLYAQWGYQELFSKKFRVRCVYTW